MVPGTDEEVVLKEMVPEEGPTMPTSLTRSSIVEEFILTLPSPRANRAHWEGPANPSSMLLATAEPLNVKMMSQAPRTPVTKPLPRDGDAL